MSIGNSLAGLFGLGETDSSPSVFSDDFLKSLGIEQPIKVPEEGMMYAQYMVQCPEGGYISNGPNNDARCAASDKVQIAKREQQRQINEELIKRDAIAQQFINDQMMIQNGSNKQRNMVIALSAAAIASLALYYMYKK